MPRDPRHDVLFEPLEIGPRVLAQSLLPGAPLHGWRVRAAGVANGFQAHEGRGRLGGSLHRVLRDPSDDRQHAPGIGCQPVGRRRCAQPWDDGRRGAFRRRARRRGALLRRHVHRRRRDSSRSARAESGDERVRAAPLSAGDGPRRHPRSAGAGTPTPTRRAVAAGFDIVYVYGAHNTLVQQFMTQMYNALEDNTASPRSRLVRASSARRSRPYAMRSTGRRRSPCASAWITCAAIRQSGWSGTACPSSNWSTTYVDLWDITITDGNELGRRCRALRASSPRTPTPSGIARSRR